MITFCVSVVLVIGMFYLGEFFGRVWKDIHEYETMRARGYKLMKNDKGEDMWVG
jgi:hypothetical protein